MTTEGRKFGLAATYLHVERFGQIAHNQQLLGATQAIVNKGMFQSTVNDADEFAPEFAKDSITEIRERQRLVISQEPFKDLLRGHTNPQIQAFVNRYLRELPYRIEDTHADIERHRLERLDYFDEVALDRIDLQMVTDGVTRHKIASAATRGVQLAQYQTASMLALHDYAQGLRQGIRGLNHIFTALMEGRIAPGQGSFSAFLLDRVSTLSTISPTLVPVLRLYISLTYGNPNDSPSLPFTFAKAYGFFPEVINAIQQEAEEEIRREKEALKKQELEKFKQRKTDAMSLHKKNRDKRRDHAWQSFCNPMTYQFTTAGRVAVYQPLDFKNSGNNQVLSHFLNEYKRIYHNPYSTALLSPYFTARFAEPWAGGFPYYHETSSDLLEVIRQEREVTLSARKSNTFWKNRKAPRIKSGFRQEPDYGSPPKPRYDLDYLDEVEQFVRKYQESALVVFALLKTLEKPLRWRQFPASGSLFDRLNMMYLPTLVNRDPFEVFLLLAKLDELLPDYKHDFTRRISNWEEKVDDYYYEFNGGQLSDLLAQSRDERAKQEWWTNSEKPIQIYLMARAYFIAYYGQSIANQTFPHPTLQVVSSDEVSDISTRSETPIIILHRQ